MSLIQVFTNRAATVMAYEYLLTHLLDCRHRWKANRTSPLQYCVERERESRGGFVGSLYPALYHSPIISLSPNSSAGILSSLSLFLDSFSFHHHRSRWRFQGRMLPIKVQSRSPIPPHQHRKSISDSQLLLPFPFFSPPTPPTPTTKKEHLFLLVTNLSHPFWSGVLLSFLLSFSSSLRVLVCIAGSSVLFERIIGVLFSWIYVYDLKFHLNLFGVNYRGVRFCWVR